jgi:MoaA/NifB/PqqE/SkfB family radical SAM enzyme
VSGADRIEAVAAPTRTQPRRLTHLPVLVLHVHSSCNCRCVMCDIWKTSESRALQPAELVRHVTEFRRLGVRWVVFSGGEPLLNRAFPELCRMLRAESVQVTLLTTGLLMRKYAREITASFDDAIVSLDGPEDIHDKIRNVAGGFRLIERGARAIREIDGGFRITARTTVQRLNFGHLRETIGAAKDLRLNGISLLAVDLTSHAFNRPLVWPVEKQNEVGLGVSDIRELEQEMSALVRQNAEDIQSGFVAESAEKLWRIVRHFRAHVGLEKAEAPQCNAPWTSAVVEVDGTVRPCFFHAPVGNICEQSLEEAINSERAIEFRSALDIASNPICRRCVCSLNYQAVDDAFRVAMKPTLFSRTSGVSRTDRKRQKSWRRP